MQQQALARTARIVLTIKSESLSQTHDLISACPVLKAEARHYTFSVESRHMIALLLRLDAMQQQYLRRQEPMTFQLQFLIDANDLTSEWGQRLLIRRKLFEQNFLFWDAGRWEQKEDAVEDLIAGLMGLEVELPRDARHTLVREEIERLRRGNQPQAEIGVLTLSHLSKEAPGVTLPLLEGTTLEAMKDGSAAILSISKEGLQDMREKLASSRSLIFAMELASQMSLSLSDQNAQ